MEASMGMEHNKITASLWWVTKDKIKTWTWQTLLWVQIQLLLDFSTQQETKLDSITMVHLEACLLMLLITWWMILSQDSCKIFRATDLKFKMEACHWITTKDKVYSKITSCYRRQQWQVTGTMECWRHFIIASNLHQVLAAAQLSLQVVESQTI